ncbi:MAG: hypothetical protein N3A59_03150 [Thermodesulfovibrionales bacterium]|nr:hypothetical protein [Thermodesulfovibrionales bacterium]
MNKKFKIGFLIGSILGLIVSVGMDFIMGGTLNSDSWTEAVSHDLSLMFKSDFKSTDPIVYLIVLLVVGFIVVVSGLLGGIFLQVIGIFLEFMSKRSKDS